MELPSWERLWVLHKIKKFLNPENGCFFIALLLYYNGSEAKPEEKRNLSTQSPQTLRGA